MAHHLHGTEVNPLLNIDILHNIFAQIPAVDSDTSARMTEVCRHWWTVGHRYVWGQSFNQLRGLVLHVNDPARRAYFASKVKHIHIEPADDTLTDDQNILSELEFPRLESISLYLSNIEEMRSENIEALMVPSLRSFTLDVCDLKWRDDSEYEEEAFELEREDDREKDATILLNALMICRASLTTLNLSFDGNLPERVEPLLLRLLNGLTAIEHLNLAWISETIIETGDPVDLVQAMLVNKPKLVSLVFPEDTFLYKHEVDNFLSRVGRDWSIPSLRIIHSGADWSTFVNQNTSAPYFGSSLAAARFVDRLPNLEHLSIGIQDSRRVPGAPTSGDDVKYIFDSISKLEHLKTLQLTIYVDHGVANGEWLVQLGNLKNLESLVLDVRRPSTISFTGAHLACFFNDVPNLNQFVLKLEGSPVVSCSPETRKSIEAAIAKIEHVELFGMTFVTQDPLPTGQ
jgi:hypothetical protein